MTTATHPTTVPQKAQDLLPDTAEITVSEHHVSTGYRRLSFACPINKALTDHFSGTTLQARQIYVLSSKAGNPENPDNSEPSPGYIVFYAQPMSDNGCRFFTDPNLDAWIKDFDNGLEDRPFTLKLDKKAQTATFLHSLETTNHSE